MIVDPVSRTVVAQAHTDSDHPTGHAVMVCIDRVARKQGGGAWSQDERMKEEPCMLCSQ